MIQKESIIEETTKNGIIYRKTTSNFINKSYLSTIFLGFAVISGITFANTTPNSLQDDKLLKCQEEYMKYSNEINRVNENYPNYKLEIPKSICVIENVSKEKVPEPKKLTEKEYLDELHSKVCNIHSNSPLCNDRVLFDRLYHLTEERLPMKQFYPILLGITNAESSLGLDFAKDNKGGTCYGRNNWGGTKYQIHDNNTRTYSRSLNGFNYGVENGNRFTDQHGCNLYPFKDIEEFWITKVNGMRFGYKKCIDSERPLECISYKYVGDPNVSEKSWIRNASIFL